MPETEVTIEERAQFAMILAGILIEINQIEFITIKNHTIESEGEHHKVSTFTILRKGHTEITEEDTDET